MRNEGPERPDGPNRGSSRRIGALCWPESRQTIARKGLVRRDRTVSEAQTPMSWQFSVSAGLRYRVHPVRPWIDTDMAGFEIERDSGGIPQTSFTSQPREGATWGAARLRLHFGNRLRLGPRPSEWSVPCWSRHQGIGLIGERETGPHVFQVARIRAVSLRARLTTGPATVLHGHYSVRASTGLLAQVPEKCKPPHSRWT